VLGLRRPGFAGPGDVLDVVAVGAHQALDPLRPQRGDDARGAPAPVVAGEGGLGQVQRVHQLQQVPGQCRLLPGAHHLLADKACRAVAPQVGNNDPIAAFGQGRGDLVVGPHVVGKTVEQDHRLASGRAVCFIGKVQAGGRDLMQGG